MSEAAEVEQTKVIKVKLPPKRSAQEWRLITQWKLSQLEAISYEIMGKRRGSK